MCPSGRTRERRCDGATELVLEQVHLAVRSSMQAWEACPHSPAAITALKNAVDYLYVVNRRLRVSALAAQASREQTLAKQPIVRLDRLHNQGDGDDRKRTGRS